MITNWFLAIASVTFVSLLSLIGIAFISVNEEKLRRIIFVMVSLAVGALFGDAFIHLLPESFARSESAVRTSLYVLTGMLSFFVLEKFLLWKHQHVLESSDQVHPVGYMNLAADAIHNLIDGMIIGVAYLVSVPVGVATTLAVVCHEIPHELGNFFVLLHAGFKARRALFFNFLSAVFAIVGTVISLLISSHVASFSVVLVPLAAGGFIYIAGSDLVPELHKEQDPVKSAVQLVGMGAGVGMMLLLTKMG
jgi:zinc and cadmium transporter